MTKKEKAEQDRLQREQEREHEIMTYQQNLPMAMLELIADAQYEDIDFEVIKNNENISLGILYNDNFHFLKTDSINLRDYDTLRNLIDEARVERKESEREALVKKQALAKLTDEEIKLLGIK